MRSREPRPSLVLRLDAGETRLLHPGERIDAARGEVVHLRCETGQGLDAVLRQALVGFGVLDRDRAPELPHAATAAMIECLQTFVGTLQSIDMRAFVVFDDPDAMEPGVLDQLRAITGAPPRSLGSSIPNEEVTPAIHVADSGPGSHQRRFSVRGLLLATAACIAVATVLLVASRGSRPADEAALEDANGFVIVAAGFDSAGPAVRAASSLVNRGVPAFVEPTARSGVFHVLAGPYLTSEEATAALTSVRTEFAGAHVSHSEDVAEGAQPAR